MLDNFKHLATKTKFFLTIFKDMYYSIDKLFINNNDICFCKFTSITSILFLFSHNVDSNRS